MKMLLLFKDSTMVKIFLVLLFQLFASSVYGQKKSINKNYNFNKQDSIFALIPIINSNFLYTDSLLNDFYSKPSFGNYKLIKSDKIRLKINEDKHFESILVKILSKQYSRKELKNFPNLNSLLDKSDIDYLRDKLNNADLILIPTELKFGTALGSTFGYSCFRLYDLNKGDFIIDCPMDFNVNSVDINIQKNLSIILIGETSEFIISKCIK